VQTAREVLQEIRRLSGRSLRTIAALGETSAPTLSSYETGRKEPRLSTLQRIADANGMDIVIRVEPRLTSPERRSLALHRIVAEKLDHDPGRVRERAERNLATMRAADSDGRASRALEDWERLLRSDNSTLRTALTDKTPRARSLRQSSPFAGVISDEERLAVLEAEWREVHE
jgi:transcriptional regulator with XRE-family HTH domain